MAAPVKLSPADLAGASFGDIISGTPSLPAGAVRISPQDVASFDDQTEETPGVAKTIALNATNLFGAAPALSGVIQHLVNNEDYAQARDRYQRMIDAANEANPIAGYVGKGASLLGETVIGGGLGKVASLGAKAIGAGRLLGEAGGLGSSIAKGVAGGAAYGAAGGAGEALSHGQDAGSAALTGGALGGLAGGALGGVAHGAGQLLRGAEDRQANSLIQGVAGGILPRERKLASRLGAKGALLGETEAEKAGITSTDALAENHKAIRKAASNNPAVAQAGIRDLEAVTDSLETAKRPHYDKLDEALGGGTHAKTPVDALRNKASVLQGRERKVLEDTANLLEEKYATVSTDAARQQLLRAIPPGDQAARDVIDKFAEKIPAGENWNKTRFLNEIAGGNALENSHTIDPMLRKQVEKLPFSFDGEARIPSRELRKVLTAAQEEAATAMGTLNATENARLKDLPRQVVQGVVNRELDRAAGSGGAEAAVKAIREINTRQSTLLHIKKFAEAQLDKRVLNKQGITPQRAAGGILGAIEGGNALTSLISGNPGHAAAHAVGAAVGTALPTAAHATATAGTDRLAWLAREARQALQAKAAGQVPTVGGMKALKIISALRGAGQVLPATAGALGAASSTTAADVVNQ
jgi:hypothetical protein